MNAKITLDLPTSLLQQVKAAALRGHITINQFVCDAFEEKLKRMPRINAAQHLTVIPSPPKIPYKELYIINKKILAAAAEIHPDDWK